MDMSRGLPPHLFVRPRLAWCAFTAATAAVPCHADVHLIVGTAAQGGKYATVQAAVDAVPSGNTERHVIHLLPGTYAERVRVPQDKPFVTLRGQDPKTTVLTYFETAATPPNEPTVHASTVVQGRDFIAENITFENSHGPGVPALAIYAKADRLIFSNCRFLGWQDTLRAEYGRQYYYNAYVEGSVDFIYGRGTAYYADYDFWRARFGATSQGGAGGLASAPEPAAGSPAVLGWLAVAARWGSRTEKVT